jgi:hypothetical protein
MWKVTNLLRTIPEPVDPVANTGLSALKCVTHVLAHPLPMSPVRTVVTRPVEGVESCEDHRCPNLLKIYTANGPRSRRPGSAPVCSLWRSTTSPLTIVARIPFAFCFSRRAPAGKS